MRSEFIGKHQARLQKPLLVLTLLLLSLSNSHAVDFEKIQSGHWAIEGENGPGSGVNVSVQNNRIALTIFTYDESGNATWLTSNGVLDASSRPSFSGELFTASSGTGIANASFSPSQFINTGQIVQIQFTTRTTAYIQFGDTTKRIRYLRFAGEQVNVPGSFGDNEFPLIPDLSGEWIFVKRGPQIETTTYTFQFQRTLPPDPDSEITAIVYENANTVFIDNAFVDAFFICGEGTRIVNDIDGQREEVSPQCILRIGENGSFTSYAFDPDNFTPNRLEGYSGDPTLGIPAEPIEVFFIRLGESRSQ